MSSDAQDIAVARHVKQAGLVSPEQVAQALQAQGQSLEKGRRITLLDALVQVGAITPFLKQTIEKQVKGQQKKGGAQQLSHYKIVKKLGEGGMGAVYLAEDARNGNRVALKVLLRKQSADEEFLKRFRREAEAAKSLAHPNIVRAFDAGHDLGYHFYVMEYCEGQPLDVLLQKEGLLSWHRSFQIVRDVSKGLQFAHQQGFIHRDIKPANIFIVADGSPKILDLGLAKSIDSSSLSFQTLSGVMVGTPHYISPEQAAADKNIDGRTDIYSLGAMLYHLLTGDPPFGGSSVMEIIAKHVNAELPNPQDVTEHIPDGVIHVLRKMMAKKPKDRYADCGDLLHDVERVLEGKSPESAAIQPGASSVAHLRRQIQGARRRRVGHYRPASNTRAKSNAPMIFGAIGAAAILVIVLLMALGRGGASPPPYEKDTGNTSSAGRSNPNATLQNPKPTPPPSAQPPRVAQTPAKLRSEEAQSKLDEIKALEKARRFAPDEVRRRYAEFAKNYADTPQGATIADWLVATKPEPPVKKPPDKPEPVAVTPKPPDPPPVAVVPKSNPLPVEPAAKPPVQKPQPALPALWKLLVENKGKLKGKPVTLSIRGFEKERKTVSAVTEKGISILIQGVGETTLDADRLSPEDLAGLVRLAAGRIPPEAERALAALEKEREKARSQKVYSAALKRAKDRMSRKDWKRAVAILKAALKIKPGDAAATKLLGEAEGHMGPAPTLRLELGDGVAMEFIYVKPGVFMMGGTEAPQESWEGDPTPPHQVTITKGFYMGKTEVKQGQWEAVMEGNPSRFKGDPKLPVEMVSWLDCEQFIEKFNEKCMRQLRGLKANLPTEAEWEYGCRAGTKTKWSFGDEESALGEYGWYGGNSGSQTHPVGGKKPNAWGLFDMHGNVWEWTHDWVGPYTAGAVSDPKGPATGERKVQRGGSWGDNTGRYTRCEFRDIDNPPASRRDLVGFRTVLR